jgi:hypothetical protein
MKSRKTVTVYEVIADGSGDGPAGDGTFVRRFRTAQDAAAFAAVATCYGRPAQVQIAENVPRHIAQRWGMV